jgi:UPF0755 protein
MALLGGNRSEASRERTAEERDRDREERMRRRAARASESSPATAHFGEHRVEAPGTEAPGTEAPGVDVPGVEMPGTEVPGTEVPKTEAPGVDVPGLDAPGTEAPGVDAPKTEVPGVEVAGAEVPSSGVQEAEEPRAEALPVEEPRAGALTAELAGQQSAPYAKHAAPSVQLSLPAGERREKLREHRASRLRAHRASAGARKGRRLTRARVGALVALAAAIVLVWLLLSLFQPLHGAERGSVIVSIPKGSSASRIGSILARDGVVSSGFFFDARALLEGKRGELHSGRFKLRGNMSYTAAIDALSKPPPRVIAVRVSIPEGETRSQIASIAAADDLTGSYLGASRRSSLLDPVRYGAPRQTPDLEGFLFPATYELRAGESVGRLVAEQLAAFRAHFGAAEIHRAHVLHLTPYELLSVASMIEREALLAGDRRLVAAVIYNRLRLGMTLGIDATLRYALNDYTHPLTEAQLRLDSPYNTRLRHGLPPTPIGNPGMASIQAAAHPAHVSYLYYVAGADGCGELNFSTGYAQFLHNEAAYRSAIEKHGGRVPTCRKK